VTLRIVGTATMPTIGESGETHLEMGTGALFSSRLIPPIYRNPFNDPLTGPEDIFVTTRNGVDPSVALHSLEQMTGPLSNPSNFGVAVLAVQRPAEIVNYRALGTTPAILAAALGAGVVAGLTLTLFASVRRRRRDLALLKTLGFSHTQLASTVRWQSIVAVAIGTVVGVPLGIVAGRTLWNVFAGDINAVPAPAVPALTIIVIAVGALLLATLVALLPGRMAARTPTALLLQSE
jgi:ABC-type antimicrobial peptide transport system permease subunit